MDFKDKVNAVHSEVQELQNELAIPDSYMNGIFEMFEALRDEKVISIQETIDDYINRRVDEAVSMRFHDVFTKMTEMQSTDHHLQSEIDDLDERANSMEGEIYDLQSESSVMEDKLEERLSDLEDGDVTTRISALEEDLLQFNGNVVESKIREAFGNLKVQLKVREV